MSWEDRIQSTAVAVAGNNDWTAPEPQPPSFTRGERLDPERLTIGTATALNDKRVYNSGVAIEYIHFGVVHPDNSQSFNHGAKDDTDTKTAIGENERLRAIQFRCGLEREAILLNGFMTGLQLALDEIHTDQGGLGEAAKLLADVVGGFGGSQDTEAGDLNSYGDGVTATAKKLDASDLTYKLIHKSGVQLHFTRAKYRAYLHALIVSPPGSKLAKTKIPPKLQGAADLLGGFAAMVTVVLSKPLHVWMALLARISEEVEPVIENACRAITVDAIKGNWTPVFNVWSHDESAVKGNATVSAKMHLLPGIQGTSGNQKLNQAIAKADHMGQKVNQGVLDVQNWWTLEGRDGVDSIAGVKNYPDTDPYLQMAFDNTLVLADKKDTPTAQDPPKALADIVEHAFESAIGVHLPPAISRFAKALIEISESFVRAVYQEILGDMTVPITNQRIYDFAVERMITSFVDHCTRHFKELNDLRLQKPTNVDGLQLGVQGLFDNYARQMEIDIEPVLHPILQEMALGMADILENARQQAVNANSLTMEVYLGLLPHMIALNFRDTFFPIWRELVDEVFLRNDPHVQALSAEVKTLRAGAAGALKTIDQGRAVIKKMRSHRHDRLLSIKHLKEYGAAFNSGTGEDPAAGLSAHPAMKKFFPFTSRTVSAAGQVITRSEYNAVRPEERW